MVAPSCQLDALLTGLWPYTRTNLQCWITDADVNSSAVNGQAEYMCISPPQCLVDVQHHAGTVSPAQAVHIKPGRVQQICFGHSRGGSDALDV